MKLHLTKIVLTAGLSALLGSLAASAQNQRAVANVPFTYHVGQSTLSAGKYTVQETNTPSIFLLRDDTSRHSIFVSVIPEASGKDNSKLMFSCYAGQCSLSQIWMVGNGYKLTARPFPREAKNQMGVVALISVPLLSR
jgi:hypothetical protein